MAGCRLEVHAQSPLKLGYRQHFDWPGTLHEAFFDACVQSDGSVFAVAPQFSSFDNPNNARATYLIKYGPAGEKLFQKRIFQVAGERILADSPTTLLIASVDWTAGASSPKAVVGQYSLSGNPLRSVAQPENIIAIDSLKLAPNGRVLLAYHTYTDGVVCLIDMASQSTLWSKRFSFGSFSKIFGSEIALVDPNACAAVFSDAGTPVSGTHAIIAKIDLSGALLWTNTVATEGLTADTWYSRPCVVALASGDIVMTTTRKESNDPNSAAIVDRFSSAGAPLPPFSDPTVFKFTGLSINAEGNLIAVGVSVGTGAAKNVSLREFDGVGQIVRSQNYDCGLGLPDTPLNVMCQVGGGISVAARSQNASGYFTTSSLKVSSTFSFVGCSQIGTNVDFRLDDSARISGSASTNVTLSSYQNGTFGCDGILEIYSPKSDISVADIFGGECAGHNTISEFWPTWDGGVVAATRTDLGSYVYNVAAWTKSGALRYQTTLNGNSYLKLAPSSDGSVFASYANSSFNGVTKLSSTGAILWSTYVDSNFGSRRIFPDMGSGCIDLRVGAGTIKGVHLSSTGQILTTATYTTSADIFACYQTAAGDILMAGYYTTGVDQYRIAVFRYVIDGPISQLSDFQGPGSSFNGSPAQILTSPDESMYLGFTARRPQTAGSTTFFMVVKLSSNGQILWQLPYSQSGSDSYFYDFDLVANGNLAIGSSFAMLVSAGTGQTIWQKSYGGWVTAIGKGVVIGTVYNSLSQTGYDYKLMPLDSAGNESPFYAWDGGLSSNDSLLFARGNDSSIYLGGTSVNVAGFSSVTVLRILRPVSIH